MNGQGDDDLMAWAPAPAVQRENLQLPGYSNFRLIAQGGEGSVYRARQDGLGRDVAVKVLRVEDAATLARFRRELEITVRLGRQHPHIVTVLDTGTLPDGRPCIVMEHYDLGSLHDRLRARGPLPVTEVVAAGMAVADALAFAHAQGFLHRDVKPQNILVLPTSYVLADFGIARGADAGHSASLQMVSYRHAAPQMIGGDTPARADDLWSLGSTLFTLLMGVPPFASDTPDENTVLPYLERIRSAEPRPLDRDDVPPELRAVITRCLRKPRDQRFPDATELRDALAAVAASLRRQSIVDKDATMRVWEPVETVSDDPTALPDFGPNPTPEPEPAQAASPTPKIVDEPRGTMTGALADLTVRHPEQSPPDFGPGVASDWQWAAPTPTGDSLAVRSDNTDGAPGEKLPADEPTQITPAAPTSFATRQQGAPQTEQTAGNVQPPAEGDERRFADAAGVEVPHHRNGPGHRWQGARNSAKPSRQAPSTKNASAQRPIGEVQPGQGIPATASLNDLSTEHPSSAESVDTALSGGELKSAAARQAPASSQRAPQDPFSVRPTTDPSSAPQTEEPHSFGKTHATRSDLDWDVDEPVWDVESTDRHSSGAVRKKRRGPFFAVAAIVAVVVGVTVGFLVNRDESQPVTQTSAPIPTMAAPVPATTLTSPATGIREGGDPQVAPILNRLVDNRTSIEVIWTDPTGGRAEFVLYDVTEQGAKPKPLTGVAAGVHSHVVPDLDAKAKQYCFQLVAIGLDDPATQRGASARVCSVRD
ncbi:MAG: protein kinase [Actinomycetota bacterium]|nr:protein kinase [Actinomycetota bacterium]